MAKSKGKRTTHKLIRFTEPSFVPYTKAIGEVSLAWNSLHEYLGLLFWYAVGGGVGLKAMGIWNSAGFDRPKRQMLRAAIEALTPAEIGARSRLVEDIVWIVTQSDTIEDHRNNAVHSPLLLVPKTDGRGIVPASEERIIPDLLFYNKRSRNLVNKEILREFRWCRDATLILRDFSFSVSLALSNDISPWPRRPSLPNRGAKRKTPAGQRQAQKR